MAGNVRSQTLLFDGLERHSWSAYKGMFVCFKICYNLKMNLNSQINPIGQLHLLIKPFSICPVSF